MGESLTLGNLRAGLPVAWTGGDPTYAPNDELMMGHPGRITDESVDDGACAVGEDLFVSWYNRPSESETCWQYRDVEVISEAEYHERVRRMDQGMPPLLSAAP